jgi:hypothetical protein
MGGVFFGKSRSTHMTRQASQAGVEQVAEALVDRFGSEAELRAELVAYALYDIGEGDQAHVWLRIVWAVNDLRRRRLN